MVDRIPSQVSQTTDHTIKKIDRPEVQLTNPISFKKEELEIKKIELEVPKNRKLSRNTENEFKKLAMFDKLDIDTFPKAWGRDLADFEVVCERPPLDTLA